MNRQEFIEKSLLMGAGLPFLSTLPWQAGKAPAWAPIEHQFKGKVLIIGAGAAGLAAGYMLKAQGVDFQILEASSVYGGRIKKNAHFADFPLDLGAEWLHVHPRILSQLSAQSGEPSLATMEYRPQSIQTWQAGKLKSHHYLRYFYREWKFKAATWFDFFEQSILPEISDHILLNQPVVAVQYGGSQVSVKTHDQSLYHADKLLITASIKCLQAKQIDFQPPLPAAKREAISKVFMGAGIKVFLEFDQRFYPDILAFGPIFEAFSAEEKFVYNAAYGKNSQRHILGLFAINQAAQAYLKHPTEAELIAQLLAELDAIFEGAASRHYQKHIIQDWSREEYIQGAYSYAFAGVQKDIVKRIAAPLAKQLYFAGEALSLKHQSMVQGACLSAYDSIAQMLREA